MKNQKKLYRIARNSRNVRIHVIFMSVQQSVVTDPIILLFRLFELVVFAGIIVFRQFSHQEIVVFFETDAAHWRIELFLNSSV